MGSQIDKIVKIFKTVYQHPIPLSGTIYNCNKESDKNSNIIVEINWSQNNFERGKPVKYNSSVFLNSNTFLPFHETTPTDSTFEILKKSTKNQNLKAIVREVQETKKKQYLEIWKNNQLWKNFDLTTLEIHGDVYSDSAFGSFDFSPNEDKLLYIAEKKQQKSVSFIQSKCEKGEIKGSEFNYRKDWGEQLEGKVQPVVVVSDIENEKINVITNIPENISPGQVLWSPDGNGIVGVGWKNEQRRLGLMFCSNRPGYIFHLTNEDQFNKLSEEGVSVRSPRFSPDGKKLLWLERQSGGPHESCHRLIMCNWETKEKEILIDIIENSMKTKNGIDFYGIYILNLPKRCWSQDGKRIVFSTQRKNEIASYVYNLEDRSLIQIENTNGSRIVMDVLDDNVLICDSSLLSPHTFRLAKLPPIGTESNNWNWVNIRSDSKSLMDNYKIKDLTFPLNSDTKAAASTFTAIYLGPSVETQSKYPLLVWSHGGPHGCTANTFRNDVLFFAKLGFAMLFVNYRGSTGSGDANIKSLLGNIGDIDVDDCHHATLEILKLESCLDSEKVCVFGGSHGGFLSLHLSGKYPEFYKVVCVRNPVVDVASMFEISDIPDWSVVECGYKYGSVAETDIEVITKMKNCSPLKNVQNVTAPTLLMLGKNDLRVQHIPTFCYYDKLLSNNIPTKILMYEDNHSLSQLPHEIDSTINIALWLKKYLDIEYNL